MSFTQQGIERRIGQLRQLVDGWDSYKAEAPNAWALFHAEILAKCWLSRIPIERVEASVVGGVGITLAIGERSAYVEVLNSESAVMLFQTSEDDPEPIVEAFRINNSTESQRLLDKVAALVGTTPQQAVEQLKGTA